MRAIGIVRQSKGREEALSPAEQRARMADHCRREGMELAEVHEEIDVSGGTPLEERFGLNAAVEAVEAGEAEVVLVAYFDRLFRSLRVQGEVVSRVEEAGGRVVAVDFGEVSERTAAQWISGTMMGVVSEYYRRSVKERSGAAQARAVEEGRIPFGQWPPGYMLGADGRLEPDPATREVVAQAFAMRAEGATIAEVRAFLLDHGIRRSYHGVQAMLASRLVLGEIHFGKLANLAAHEPIVERGIWEAVQRQRGRRGPRPKSDRLLARLDVLRCDHCGARMVVGVQTQNGRRYPFYRCPPVGDCISRVTIGAEIVEEWIVEQVRGVLAGVEGSASSAGEAVEAQAEAERAQAELDGAIAAFSALAEEPAALDRLRELRDARDAARERAEHLGRLHSALTISASRDWERLSTDARRAIIRATVERVTVGKGRGTGRLAIEFRGE